MVYPKALQVCFPLAHYELNSYKFKEDITYSGVHWGLHLGEDVNCPAGTPVYAIADGKVVYSDLHPGTKTKGNWGHIIILGHTNPKTGKVFYSLYAHLGDRKVKVGDKVRLGQLLGKIGKGNTRANGYWEAHLHFGIYTGPEIKTVPPGYFLKSQTRTKLAHWQAPSDFIENYKGQTMKVDLHQAACLLNSGKVGVIPTDTLYGLVASAFDPIAVERLYKIKYRNNRKPFIVLMNSQEEVKLLGIHVSPVKKRKLQKYWPGPVSIILPVSGHDYDYLHRGSQDLAIRVPKDRLLRSLLKASGPVVAPSANPEGKLPAFNPKHVLTYFEGKIDFYVPGGTLKGAPSRLIKFENNKEIILR